jgi:hypothetical protein
VIEIQRAKVYYAPTARRRYFSLQAAAAGEARALIKLDHPTEESDHDEFGRVTYPGFHWRQMESADKLYCDLIDKIKNEYKQRERE